MYYLVKKLDSDNYFNNESIGGDMLTLTVTDKDFIILTTRGEIIKYEKALYKIEIGLSKNALYKNDNPKRTSIG